MLDNILDPSKIARFVVALLKERLLLMVGEHEEPE